MIGEQAVVILFTKIVSQEIKLKIYRTHTCTYTTHYEYKFKYLNMFKLMFKLFLDKN